MGISLEALGFQLLVDAGLSRRVADDTGVKIRLEKIIDALGEPFQPKLNWYPAEMTKTYNSLEHARRQVPSGDKIATMADVSKVVLRVWVCLQLGISAEKIYPSLEKYFEPILYEVVADPSELE